MATGTHQDDDDDFASDGILEAARAIRPYLDGLVGPAADELDNDIAALLTRARRGEEVSASLRELMDSRPATRLFLMEVFHDRPYYRPPQIQPDYRTSRSGTPGSHATAGEPEPVRADRYTCPDEDYVWYRPAIGTPIPVCPTHKTSLILT